MTRLLLFLFFIVGLISCLDKTSEKINIKDTIPTIIPEKDIQLSPFARIQFENNLTINPATNIDINRPVVIELFYLCDFFSKENSAKEKKLLDSINHRIIKNRQEYYYVTDRYG